MPTPEQFEIIKRHLEKSVKACPVCGGTDLDVNELGALVGYADAEPIGNGTLKTSQGVPVVPVACRSCFHIITFSWLAIRRASDAEK